MFSIEDLVDYLQCENPYPCLNLLEAAVVCCRRKDNKTIPAALLMDLAVSGPETAEAEAENLAGLGVLFRTEQGLLLNPQALPNVSELLNQLKNNLQLSLGREEETAEEFMLKLVSYLQEAVPSLIVAESADNGEFSLLWQEKKYRLQLALSPVWLPAAAEEASREQTYLALFGPFAAQNWLIMLKYYSYPEFRNFTAYFDPWYRQKMNISRGGLFTFFDWFFRDVYGLKFFIPREFSLALQNMGLLRYNDER